MPVMLIPLSEEMKETILDEHPQGMWIVLEEESHDGLAHDEVPIVGHPTSPFLQDATR